MCLTCNEEKLVMLLKDLLKFLRTRFKNKIHKHMTAVEKCFYF